VRSVPTSNAIGRRMLLGGAAASLACAGALAGPLNLNSLLRPLDPRGLPRLVVAAATPEPGPPQPLPPRRIVASPEILAAWATFRDRFITADGRVIDWQNGGASHSEGQGWAMLLAASLADRATFELVAAWTARHLRRPSDALHAWRWRPDSAVPIDDWNNAADGDIYIAVALARAGALWQRPDWVAQAARIANALLTLCTHEHAGRLLLLPGAYGFVGLAGVVVNPSYYAFGLFDDLAAVAPSPLWARLAADGRAVVETGRFGAWRLPPDWLLVAANGALSPAPGWPPRYSYDAIRVPLHLAWGRVATPARDDLAAWITAAVPRPPAWTDLRTGQVAGYAASPGMIMAARLVCGQRVAPPQILSASGQTSDYYSSGLTLLCFLAWNEAESEI
jgi:endo-1,4-beta-D-glucanase Y